MSVLPITGEYPSDWKEIAKSVKDEAHWECIRCNHIHEVETGHVLTVHHFDGDKSNCSWWNLMALCQRCHLNIQARVDPNQPFFLSHSEWAQPYVAGFYAKKYLDDELNRKQVEGNLAELLALELIPPYE